MKIGKNDINSLAIRACYRARLPLLLETRPDVSLTTIAFHRFVFPQESVESGRDRLRRQCEWLRKRFVPMDSAGASAALRSGELPRNALLVTIDDGLIDLLNVADVFHSFDIPFTVFVCAGWAANASVATNQGARSELFACAVDQLEWYVGPAEEICADGGGLCLQLKRSPRSAIIDEFIKRQAEWSPYLERVLSQLREGTPQRGRSCCNWTELTDLVSMGALIGGHSVSHIKLAKGSFARAVFEIAESKRILESRFGACGAFAYPFGTPDSFSDFTDSILEQCGFPIGFSAEPGFANAQSARFRMPRIALPDRPLEQNEFRARVGGGSVVLTKSLESVERAISRFARKRSVK